MTRNTERPHLMGFGTWSGPGKNNQEQYFARAKFLESAHRLEPKVRQSLIEAAYADFLVFREEEVKEWRWNNGHGTPEEQILSNPELAVKIKAWAKSWRLDAPWVSEAGARVLDQEHFLEDHPTAERNLMFPRWRGDGLPEAPVHMVTIREEFEPVYQWQTLDGFEQSLIEQVKKQVSRIRSQLEAQGYQETKTKLNLEHFDWLARRVIRLESSEVIAATVQHDTEEDTTKSQQAVHKALEPLAKLIELPLPQLPAGRKKKSTT